MSKLQQSYFCGEAVEPLIYQTIGSYLNQVAARFPNNEALVICHQGIRWTYAELLTEIDRLAAGLLSLGIGKGDRVGVWGPNSYEWVLSQFATAKIGAILVCINPAYRLHELEYALNKVECKALVTAPSLKSSNYLQMLAELLPELAHSAPGSLHSEIVPSLRTVIRMGAENTPGMINFEEACQLGGAKEQAEMARIALELQPDDPINIQFTSGTTGNPKGATLSHCNILNNGHLAASCMGFTEKDRLCIPVPLYHCFGMVMSNLACITKGATMVYPSATFEPQRTLEVVAEERCTALHGVPAMFVAELDDPRFNEYDLSSLRTGLMGGAPCPVEVMKRVINDMHMKNVLIIYGQTETSPVNHMTLPEDSMDKRVNSVGRAVPRVEVKLIDPSSGKVVPVGCVGEICVRGYSVMAGYWDDEEKTRETIDDASWLHSGDLGVMDEEGYVSITGRIKDMIIRGGENIYPREIEEFLYTHPAVQQVQVFGVPDARMGEEVCAWVQLKTGADIDDTEIKAFCKDQIAHFKIPRYVRFVDDFPMTVSGKAQKFKMTQLMTDELGL